MPKESSREDKKVPQDLVVRNIWIGLAISLGVPLTILLIAGLWYLVAPTTPTERKDVVQALGVLLAAIAGLVGLFFTAQNVRTNQRTLRANLENTHRTLELTEQGQITERFTRAIEQLGETDDEGNKRLEIRLGGIYALERIAKDSPDRDYSTIVEVLTTYIRENTQWSLEESSDRDVMSNPPQRLAADVQAILDVLKRLREDRELQEYLAPLDLRRTNLEGAHLSGINLQEARLYEANLQDARLDGANLKKADLEKADLRSASLREANLEGARLSFHQPREGPAIKGAPTHLEGADLTAAHFERANLVDARLESAILRSAHLDEADLTGAHLEWTRFAEANLRGANLRGAVLSGAVLSGEVLPEGELQGAKNLTKEQLEQAIGDETTQLPGGLRPPASWNQGPEKQTEGNE